MAYGCSRPFVWIATVALACPCGATEPMSGGKAVVGQTQTASVLLGTSFVYQGNLDAGGVGYSGSADFRLTLWKDASSTDPDDRIGGASESNNAAVDGGVFTLVADFGAGAFAAQRRYLQVEVRTPAGAGDFTVVSPRTEIMAVPAAQYAMNASGLLAPDGSAIASVQGGAFVFAAPVEFAGPVRVAETTRSRMIAPSVWVAGATPMSRGADFQFMEAVTPGNPVDGRCAMPFDLPQDAVLREVTIWYYDASNWGNLTVKVKRAVSGPADFSTETLASGTSSGNVAAVRTLNLTGLQISANDPLFLDASWTTNSDPIRVGSVRITYTVQSPLP